MATIHYDSKEERADFEFFMTDVLDELIQKHKVAERQKSRRKILMLMKIRSIKHHIVCLKFKNVVYNAIYRYRMQLKWIAIKEARMRRRRYLINTFKNVVLEVCHLQKMKKLEQALQNKRFKNYIGSI